LLASQNTKISDYLLGKSYDSVQGIIEEISRELASLKNVKLFLNYINLVKDSDRLIQNVPLLLVHDLLSISFLTTNPYNQLSASKSREANSSLSKVILESLKNQIDRKILQRIFREARYYGSDLKVSVFLLGFSKEYHEVYPHYDLLAIFSSLADFKKAIAMNQVQKVSKRKDKAEARNKPSFLIQNHELRGFVDIENALWECLNTNRIGVSKQYSSLHHGSGSFFDKNTIEELGINYFWPDRLKDKNYILDTTINILKKPIINEKTLLNLITFGGNSQVFDIPGLLQKTEIYDAILFLISILCLCAEIRNADKEQYEDEVFELLVKQLPADLFMKLMQSYTFIIQSLMHPDQTPYSYLIIRALFLIYR